MRMKIPTVLFFSLILTSCFSHRGLIHEISPLEANKMLEASSVVLLDVRTPQEFNEEHIENSHLIPINEIENHINELPTDKSLTIIAYCTVGVRSARAVSFLQKNGFTHPLNLEGGIEAWKKEGLPVVKKPHQ
jgi:rhodanese-related sulfurtransferase